MSHFELVRSVPLPRSFRVAAVQGKFDVPVRDKETFSLSLDVPLEEFGPWQVGAIVGASGTGKSTLAREMFPRVWMPDQLSWSEQPIVEDFPKAASVDQIGSALTSVGLSSIPVWLRPYRVLSTGEQARASLARLFVEAQNPLVVDEFTSVVDRVVARALAVAIGKAIRRDGRRQFVAVTCHHDVVSWLAPDWVIDLDQRRFLQWPNPGQRPAIRLRLYPGNRAAWPIFHRHHYLTGDLAPSARIFLVTVGFPDETSGERLCGFFSVMGAVGMKGWYRGHRTVVLPDFQGLGIGNAMIEQTAEWLWTHERRRFRATTASPNLIAHRRRHPEMWRLSSGPMNRPPVSGTSGVPTYRSSAGRLSTSWEYLPVALRRVRGDDAEGDAGERGRVGVERGHFGAAVGG